MVKNKLKLLISFKIVNAIVMLSNQLLNKIHLKKKEGRQIRNQRESKDQKKSQRKVLQHMLLEIKKNLGVRALLPSKESLIINPLIKTNIGI